MSGDVTLRSPAPPGLSGTAMMQLPQSWILTASALAAGWLAISSETVDSDRYPTGQDGTALTVGRSGPLEVILGRATDRARRLTNAFGFRVGPDRDTPPQRALAELDEAMLRPLEIDAGRLVQYMAQHTVSVRHLSYGSPISVSFNLGPVGDAVRPGLRALTDFRGYRRRVKAQNRADEVTARAQEANANADIREAQYRELTARQYLETLPYRDVDHHEVLVAITEAFRAGDAPSHVAERAARALTSSPHVTSAVGTTLAMDIEVEDGPDDIWFAAP
ncbi:hypothetical protein ACFQ80_05880 [Isoptericola sp. NPDC056578]|uniref:hypothetical protein n=1 Tax=Isoptericola sp. NPDC056578 TaxID=3345870 RepID=UPI003680C4DF